MILKSVFDELIEPDFFVFGFKAQLSERSSEVKFFGNGYVEIIPCRGSSNGHLTTSGEWQRRNAIIVSVVWFGSFLVPSIDAISNETHMVSRSLELLHIRL